MSKKSMCLMEGGGKNKGGDMLDSEARRKRSLGIIHMIKRDLGCTDDWYRGFLERTFNVSTAAALDEAQLQGVIAAFMKSGWKPKKPLEDFEDQLSALRERARQIARNLPNGEKRLNGLCRTTCGTERLDWCFSGSKLKRLLAALGNIARTAPDAVRE